MAIRLALIMVLLNAIVIQTRIRRLFLAIRPVNSQYNQR